MSTQEIKPEPQPPVIIERGRRLSRSLLWEPQREFFARQGVEAWRQGTVPHYITSNPFIASAYARVVLGFLRDCQAGSPPLDPGQPVYILELGAGSGQGRPTPGACQYDPDGLTRPLAPHIVGGGRSKNESRVKLV